MKKNESYVNLILQDPQCSMISPGYKYPRDEQGMPIPGRRDKIERNPDNLIKLEQMVSDTMRERNQKELMEILEKKVPSLYIDCQKKGEDDIMFFILKEYIKISKIDNKNIALGLAIGDNSIVTESRQERKKHIQENKPTTEDILLHYNQLLKTLLQKNDDQKYKKDILDIESHITFDGLGDLMQQEDQKYLYLYLDKTDILTGDEQQRINTFLYTRGKVKNDRRIRVKINNGEGTWKTRYSSVGHRVESPHDYSSTTIYEDEL